MFNKKTKKIETLKKEKEELQKKIEIMEQQSMFLAKGFRAMNICLDYQRAIVSILETLGIEEIEIKNSILYRTEKEIEVCETPENTTIIKIKQEKGNK